MSDEKDMFAQMEKQFAKFVGEKALDSLKQAVTKRPIITIGGDQLTGKSTLSKKLAEHYGGQTISAGVIFRGIAKDRGISVGQLSKEAKDSPQIDVNIEYLLCKKIGEGIEEGPLVVEGRQPAVMATYMKNNFAKENCVRIFLSCSYREQALRFIRREVGQEAFEAASKGIAQKDFASLSEVSAEVSKLHIQGADECLKIFIDNQSRDQDDHQRYAALYGFPAQLDYRKPLPNIYDIVVDPTDIDGTFKTVVQALSDKYPDLVALATKKST